MEVGHQNPRIPHGLKVLIVDDNDHDRETHEDILKSLGAETSTVKNGKEALDLIRTVDRSFDLILMAREMPVMDGITATRCLRYLEYPAHIIGVSHRLTRDEYAEFYNAGLDRLMDNGKPLSPGSMRHIVRSSFSSKGCNGLSSK